VLALAELLLERGAELDARAADGRTAADVAAARGHEEVAEALASVPPFGG
jgi:ankyrin repeat protein